MADRMHQDFLKTLWRSYPAVWVIAWWYWRELKCHVLIPPPQAAPDRSVAPKFSDDGDLYVIREDEHESIRVEVKQLGFVFSNRQDYEMRFPNFLICSTKKFDRCQVKPSFFIVVSADRRCLGLLNVKESKGTWWKEIKGDKRPEFGPEGPQEKYLCPLDQVEFRPLRQPESDEVEERRFVEEAIGHPLDEETDGLW